MTFLAAARSAVPLADRPVRGWPALACLAIAFPTLIAYNLPPSATFFNQAASLVAWGGWGLLLAAALAAPNRHDWHRPTSGLTALLAALALLQLSTLAAPLWAGLPWSLALSAAGMLFAAALVAWLGWAVHGAGLGLPAFRALCIGLVVAGAASSAIGIVQVFAPAWPDGNWVARTYIEGRAVGNMRQPNHLSSLLLWSVIAVLWLSEAQVVRRWVGTLLALLFVFVIVLSGSRTGALSVGLLALWGLLDKRLSRPARAFLLLAPLAYAVFWIGTSAWADHGHHVFGGETRFSTQGDISSSRYGIWANTLTLIRMHPWAGVGFGEFNFAWTLTPFPGRPVAFFDHTHNLVLQFAVELGVPLALAVLALLLWAGWQALRGALAAGAQVEPAQAQLRRAAFMMVFLILVHSLLEYPLWYAYFLLPAAFAFGLCLAAAPSAPVRAHAASEAPARIGVLSIGAMLLMLGGLASLVDYYRVVVIFAPSDGAAPLAQRIAAGRRSVFFAHHADYAAATTSEHPSDAMPSFLSAPHYLLDARLMEVWAKALNEAGDTERARFVAQRLREFNNDQAEAFFEPCDTPPAAGEAPPFQCVPPTRAFGYQDFR